MLGPQPPQRADRSPNARQHDPNNVAMAATLMMWAVALATRRASLASAAHGLALWSRMLSAPIYPWSLRTGTPAQGLDASLHASAISTRAAPTPGGSAQDAAGATAPAEAPGEEAAAFASYRSSGGHASAQVITHH